MTESLTPNHHAPIDAIPKLVPSALSPFRALLWAGLILLILGLVVALVGSTKNGYDEELQQLSAFAFAGGCLQWATPFLVGAGIIAGLGKRETNPSAPKRATTALGSYVPVDES